MFEALAKRKLLLGSFLVTVVAILAYANTVGNGFIWTDRTFILEENAVFRSFADLARVFYEPLWAFTGAPSAGGGYYRPVVAISYTVDYALYGENPAGFHVTNVLVHAAVTLFFFLFLGRVFPKSRVPLIAAVLFAVHPIHTEAVAWIAGRTGLLSALGIVAALYFYTRAREHLGFLVGSLAAFAFGLGAKETAAVLPILILLVSRQLRRPGERWLSWAREASYFVVLLGYLVVRRFALGGFGTGNPTAIDPVHLLPTMLRVLGGYLGLLFLPYPLNTNDAVRISTSLLDLRAILSLVFIAAAVYGFLRLGRGRPETSFGLLWMAVAILPFLNLLPLLHFRAERLLYLPSAGFVVAVAALLDRWAGSILRRDRLLGLSAGEFLAAVLAVVLVFGTVARNRTWKDDLTLFSDTLRKSEYAPEARYMLGVDAFRKGAYGEAVDHFRSSVTLDPGWVAFIALPEAYTNLGLAYIRTNDPVSAEPAFREALRSYPGMEQATYGLALATGTLGRHAEAASLYGEILEGNPGHEDARYNLALAYEGLGRLDRAEDEYRRLLDLDPDRKDALVKLGALLGRRGAFAEALDAFRAALRIEPDNPRIHYNVGLLFALAGERARAGEALRIALQLDPGYEDARRLLERLASEQPAAAPETP